MILAIPIAEKLLAGLTTLATSAADSPPSVATLKAGAADFANTLDGLDQNGAAATPQHGAHTAGANAASAAG